MEYGCVAQCDGSTTTTVVPLHYMEHFSIFQLVDFTALSLSILVQQQQVAVFLNI